MREYMITLRLSKEELELVNMIKERYKLPNRTEAIRYAIRKVAVEGCK